MQPAPRETPRATGRCLCGAVAYEVYGSLRDILLCHCEECRRWSGYLGAFTSTPREHLIVGDEGALRWIDSPHSDRRARRGFCGKCGSSLFWQPAESERVHIAVGTLDRPTGLRIAGHWYADHAGDYDVLPEDGLPRGEDVCAETPPVTRKEQSGPGAWSKRSAASSRAEQA